jgi:hypothetical protein
MNQRTMNRWQRLKLMPAIGLDGSRVESSEIEIDARNEKTAKNKENRE